MAKAPEVLKVFGLGSCVALSLYDPKKKVGGLAHILLPGPAPKKGKKISGDRPSGKYADRAVAELVRALKERGGDPGRMVAKMAGGATMFSPLEEKRGEIQAKSAVGERNVAAVKKQLKKLKIPIAGEDVGGGSGRTITFETLTGRFLVKSSRDGRKVI